MSSLQLRSVSPCACRNKDLQPTTVQEPRNSDQSLQPRQPPSPHSPLRTTNHPPHREPLGSGQPTDRRTNAGTYTTAKATGQRKQVSRLHRNGFFRLEPQPSHDETVPKRTHIHTQTPTDSTCALHAGSAGASNSVSAASWQRYKPAKVLGRVVEGGAARSACHSSVSVPPPQVKRQSAKGAIKQSRVYTRSALQGRGARSCWGGVEKRCPFKSCCHSLIYEGSQPAPAPARRAALSAPSSAAEPDVQSASRRPTPLSWLRACAAAAFRTLDNNVPERASAICFAGCSECDPVAGRPTYRFVVLRVE